MLKKVLNLIMSLVRLIFGIKQIKSTEADLIKKEQDILKDFNSLEKQRKGLQDKPISDIIDKLNKK